MGPSEVVFVKTPGIVVLTFVSVAAAVALCYAIAPHPPISKIEQCRISLGEACRHEAATFAPTLYAKSDSCFETLLRAWSRQNQRFFLARNFDSVLLLATQCDSLARVAKYESQSALDSFACRIPGLVANVERRRAFFVSRYKSIPIDGSANILCVRSGMDLAEGKAALASGRTKIAYVKIENADKQIAAAIASVSRELSAYFENSAAWLQWVGQTKAWSCKTHRPAIVIDKLAHSLYVYAGGKRFFSAHVELGPRWLGQKAFQGDKATPEGKYTICRKKGKDQSEYYRALVLNYPNSADRSAFRSLQKSGTLPISAEPGGLVEIHGGGNRGADWTNGCIALANCDMNRVFDIAAIGTPVTIVGSADTSKLFAVKENDLR